MTSDRARVPTSLGEGVLAPLMDRLRAANNAFDARYPGDSGALQPVQTMYEGAHVFDADVLARIRTAALRSLERNAPDPGTLAEALALEEDAVLIQRVHARVRARLEQQPLDDYRLDFEDGYGIRHDAEEDAEAVRAARAAAQAVAARALPPGIGIRIKPLTEELRARAVRTLDVFVSTLIEAAGSLPPGFVVTLPKLTSPEQAGVFADLLDALESKLGLTAGTLRFEFMVELPQIVLDADGICPLPRVLARSRGRAIAAHFGTYDYTAACGISAAHQAMHHPVCEFAKQMMRVAFAGTGLWLSDGSTNILPVEPYPDDDDAGHARANRAAIHAAWRRHYDDVQGSLRRGFYQGWDLHPAQLVTRYAALYVFFLRGFDAAAQRLRALVQKASDDGGGVQDDPATGQALLSYVRRAVACGVVTETEVAAATGLTTAELDGRAFATVLAARR